jgi:hypothetical protein
MINGLNTEERNISKYIILAKNETPSYTRCITYEENGVCFENNNFTISFSYLGECYTVSPLRYPKLSFEISKFLPYLRNRIRKGFYNDPEGVKLLQQS